ncbi:atos homolog protein A [Centruroides vittatus]|uniref:atos homolog protein A n=1 Tax=Centruroides vittatus TaxID=120091 RepID=UPI0035101D2C
MKPDEEMHADVAEEVELDPCDLYTDLGTLIIEGRIPGLTERGFGEGPHCLPVQGQNRHQCDLTSPECQRHDVILKHMLLLWKNRIPMSIEVLLYPECCSNSTSNQTIDNSSVSDISYLLLEQWTIHMLPRRITDATISCRGLIQAVRSFLHFSQLSAWLSLTGGQSPQNIHYRVCVPEEAFSSKFTTKPDLHVFPIANVARSNAMKVVVRSHPRCGKIPKLECFKHNVVCDGFESPKPSISKIKSVLEEECGANCKDDDFCPEDGIINEQFSSTFKPPSQKVMQNKSPADCMLGESLLDPPPSLQMYPKRYQSPSRCGSPSIEVPEHLMFGKAANVRREAERNRIHSQGKERSRPQRRPVIERFLKKNFNDDDRIGKEEISGKHTLPSSERLEGMKSKLKLDQNDMEVCNYVCNGNDTSIPLEEMQHVLNRLRQRCPGTKHSTNTSQIPFQTEKPSVFNIIPQRTDLPCSSKQKYLSLNETTERTLYQKQSKTTEIKSKLAKFTEECKIQKNIATENEFESSFLSTKLNSDISDQLNSVPSVNNAHSISNVKSEKRIKCASNNDMRDSGNENFKTVCITSDSVINNNVDIQTYQEELNEMSTNQNFNNKCDCFQNVCQNKSWIAGLGYGGQKSSLVQNLLRAGALAKENDLDRKSHLVPSADQKAQFRRSLDSATCMVFHQKTGLPLTSSPAPIRKSGTCFDFDSSLTSVSAIKRALFEKDPEEEIDKLQLSTSAPASITTSNLLGNFEESVLNGRLEPVSTVEGFTAELGASGSFCPRHITLPVTVFFYTLQDTDKMASPYLGHINLGKKGYHVPRKGTVQVTLFNPHQTVVKMFVVRYDLCDMPVNCQTFIRQRTLYMPADASDKDPDASKWLRYLIHLRFSSSRSGRIYLHTDIRMIIFRKSDLDAATVHSQRPYELRSFTQGPINPRFSPLK